MLAECENVFPLGRKSGQMPAAHEIDSQKHPFSINRFESSTYLRFSLPENDALGSLPLVLYMHI